MSSLPVQDDTEALLSLFNAADSGPSDFGVSHHETWIECGRKGELRQAEKDAANDDEAEDVSPDPAVLSKLKVGVFAHKLWEGRTKRQLGDDLIWDARASVFNASFLKAVELYRNYFRIWGSIEERFGCEVLGAEVSLGGPAVAARVIDRLGGPYTGRADATINVIDPDKAKRNTGLILMPGKYIYDLKTGEKRGSDDEAKYRDGLQSKGYLWLDCLEHGDDGALGFIADRVLWGHKVTDREKSYSAYVSYPDIFAEEKLRALIRLSNRSKADPQPNPLACAGKYNRPCFYKTSGRCPGY